MDKPIPHSKTTLQYEDIHEITKTVTSGYIASGTKVSQFRNVFSKFIENESIHFYSSGSSAFYHLLLTLNLPKNSEVLIPTYICKSVKNAIEKANLKVILYDNALKSWISNVANITKKVTPIAKVLLINHTFGIRYKKETIIQLKSLGLVLIEDCAHLISNQPLDIEISSLCDASFYSFNATKLLTTGEGGAVSFSNNSLFNDIEKYSLDSGFSDLNATLGISQLKSYPEFLIKRQEIANLYNFEFTKIFKNFEVLDSIFFRYPIYVTNKKKFLDSPSVSFKEGVDNLLHPSTQNIEYPHSCDMYNSTISIPIYPSLTQKEIEIIIKETERLYYAS
jgi:perosamine synthetase